MSNSGLVSYTKISPNKNSPRNHAIDTITIHCVVGQCSVETLGNVFESKSREVSSNYGVGYDGRIGLYVEEKDRSWCSSNSANDNRAITIEVASDTYSPYAVTDAAFNALINLCVDICRRNGIKKLVWSTDRNTRVNHLNGCNMTVHRDYANKSCPGEYLYSRMGTIAQKVNAKLGVPGSSVAPLAPLADSVDSVDTLDYVEVVDVEINYDQITPYIVTLSRNVTGFDSAKFKKFGGVGVVIEAGYLFDSSHTRVSKTRNPNIAKQADFIANSDLGFGMYWTARARTVEEVDEEMDELSYLIYKYPPNIGMWLKLDLTRTKAINDSIIKQYQKRLVNLGLKGKIGFYNKQSQLSKISWKDFCKDWLFWDTNHVAELDLNNIKENITPAMFEVSEDL